jgi:16S rRNA processing protein RimM
MRHETVLLAEVDRPRGLRGEVMATLHADDPERLDEIDQFFVVPPGGEAREARLEGWKRAGRRVVLKITGIESVDQARTIMGSEIRIPASDSPSTAPEGRYFAHQLEGLEVVDRGGERLGKVSKVLCPAGQALLVVAGPRGECLVPLVPAICVRIDPEGGRIEIDPPEGLIELNAV